MAMRTGGRAWIWALAAASLLLSACGEAARQPGPAELALATGQLDEELNAPAQEIRSTLRLAAADGRIYAEEIVLTGSFGSTPMDWWVYRHGYIKPAGFDAYGHGYFVPTPKGEALLKGPPQKWLSSAFQGAPRVACAGNGGWQSCRVTGVAVVSLTREGADLFEGVTLASVAFTCQLEYGPSGWSASELETTPPDLSAGLRAALFGDHDAIQKAHYDWGMQMNRRARSLFH
jgi:hypothetical protein